MFTHLELKCSEIFFKIASKSPACPYDYHDGTLVRTKSKVQPYVWGADILSLFVWLTISIVQLKATISKGNVTEIVLNAIYVCGVIGSTTVELSLWVYADQIADFVNGTQVMNHIFDLRHGWSWSPKAVQRPIRERLYALTICLYGLGATFYGGFILFTRNYSFSIYYFLWNDLNLKPELSFIVLTVLVLIIVTEAVFVGELQMVTVYFIMSTIFWTRKACVEWPKADVDPRISLSVYKCCYLLNNRFNAGLGQIFIPTGKYFLMFVLLASVSGLICHFDKLDWISMGTMILFTICSLCAIWPGAIIMSTGYSISSTFDINLTRRIQRMEDSVLRRRLIKELKACQVIRCNIGNFYFMESKAKLAMAENLVNWLMFLIVQNSVD